MPRSIDRQAKILGRVRRPWTAGRAGDLTDQQRAIARNLTRNQRKAWRATGYKPGWLDDEARRAAR